MDVAQCDLVRLLAVGIRFCHADPGQNRLDKKPTVNSQRVKTYSITQQIKPLLHAAAHTVYSSSDYMHKGGGLTQGCGCCCIVR